MVVAMADGSFLGRNDAHIDELCRALKLNANACEHYGVHLMKALQ
jgi:hypothetical protein